ncbi:MAG: tripartite tricarboxylate transporter TctB family protein [Kiloniellales bacterium]|nr:tripartite tricarboxylate transporter TctB family protein [Kiloniellales bacterium]
MAVQVKPNGATAVATLTLATALLLFWHTFDPAYDTAFVAAGRGPVFYPRILLGIIVALATAVAVQSLFQASGEVAGRALPALLSAIGLTGGYVLAFSTLGYLLSTIVYAFVLPFVFGYRKVAISAAFAAGYALATWYLFEKVFLIILPKSPWFTAF